MIGDEIALLNRGAVEERLPAREFAQASSKEAQSFLACLQDSDG